MAHQARKRFGQHFLTDTGYITDIVTSIRPNPEDRVIEIGPGLGAMTIPLLGELGKLEVVEIDRDLVSFWRKKNLPGLEIHESDALKFDFSLWASEAKKTVQGTSGQVKIVGNLPYNISSPLLFHLLTAIDAVDVQVFMLQLEVVERMIAAEGSHAYGRLSVMMQARYHMENLVDVPPEAFEPPPRVNSAVIEMIPRKDIEISDPVWRKLEKIVAVAFSQRRKMLGNNLADYKERLNLSPETLRLRAQDISVETYLEWARRLTD